MRLAFVAAVLAISSLVGGSVRAQNFPCSATSFCDFWVAVQPPGDSHSFFSKDANRVAPSDIKTGDLLTAAVDINVRPRPVGFGSILFVINAGQQVEITGTRTVSGGGGQIWAQIRHPTVPTRASPAPSPAASPPALHTGTPTAKQVEPCEQPPASDQQGPVPIIDPPVSAHPPSAHDLQRLLVGRPIFCDQYGLIVSKNTDGTFNGGDTLAREGWYWLGVWIRQHTPGMEAWKPNRMLTFDQVLALVEPNGDGIFYRHPKQAPYNKGFDKEWGTSRDQIVPIVAAMGVWGKNDAIRRLWDALPEDIQGKHAFNGNWRNALGQDGENCTALKTKDCSPTRDCPAEVNTTPCDVQVDNESCPADTNTDDCHREQCVLRRPWDGGCAQTASYNDPICEGNKAIGNFGTKASCEARKVAINTSAKANCEARKASENAATKATCEATKASEKLSCETQKWTGYQLCRLSNIFNGDLIGPATVNLFRRALDQNPLIPDDTISLPTSVIQVVDSSGMAGEAELLINTHLITGKSHDDHDYVDPDINHIVNLLMAKLRFPTFVSDNATQEYFSQRAHSFGSYLGPYYAQYGDDMKDFQNRLHAGIASNWKPDVSAPMGAVRWYHRPNTADGHANPQLAVLYQDIVERLLKP